MVNDMVAACMNPVRQRILQYLIAHKQGTTAEIGASLNDVPTASLYRHIKVLLEAEIIQVAQEKAVRGTVERTYSLRQHTAEEYSVEKMGVLFQTTLLSLSATFGDYFARPDADPVRDMLSISAATLLLTDEEYMALLQQVGALFGAAAQNTPAEGRKERIVSLVSAPAEKEK